jgi:cytochrome c-type biogenesis protein CcmH
MVKLILRGLIISLFLIFPAAQTAGDEQLNPDLEKQAKEIENLIIAPCCWRQPVAVHFSPAADEVRTEIRQMLASGMKEEEILDAYVAEYGEKIRAKPKAAGFNLLAYFLPVAFLIAGAVVAFIVIRHLRPKTQAVGSKQSAKRDLKPGTGYSPKLEKEMWG